MEAVLVFESNLLDRIGQFQGYSLEAERYLDAILNSESLKFIERETAERDPRYKQLIPYVVLCWNKELFTYLRGASGGEQRLRRKRSIGLGGHIEKRDAPEGLSGRTFYFEAIRREITEEVLIDGSYTEKIVAVLNDDTNDVGRVHFGILHIWFLQSPIVYPKEPEIDSAEFLTVSELNKKRHECESWSNIALDILSDSETLGSR